jgi:serine-type D-Ala-D-Ala carboxypeptidase (penicillin-binding protein 5/6)
MRLTALAVVGAVVALVAHRADAQAADRWPDVAAAYVVAVDGVERWSHAANARMRPASLTKILTAVIVIESGGDDAIVTVSARAASAQGARIGLRRGMQMRVGELLTAMLLRSANDACLALAEHVAGTEQSFVAQMNARASALGLADSHFENACGFDAPRHRVSARDLARLARHAMADRRFATIVGRERGEARTRHGRVFAFDNTNALIGRVDGARGVKTGWTQAAGRCLVVFAERRGTTVTLVLLGAPDRWWDAVAMIETAFEEARASPAPQK